MNIEKIQTHYDHAREKHPYFCDTLVPNMYSTEDSDGHLRVLRNVLKKQTGNAAAMHAALRQIKQMGIELRNIIPHLDKNWEECLKASIRIYQTAERALLEPPRNCDVGTPYEQAERFNHQCFEYHTGRCSPHCSTLPAKSRQECALKWAQMLYTEEGAGK